MSTYNVKDLITISKKDADESFSSLLRSDIQDISTSISTAGNKTVDYYTFKHRIKTTVKGVSLYDVLTKTKYNNKLQQLVKFAKVLYKTDKINVKMIHSAFRLTIGSVNQFRPTVAKHIYLKYKTKTILDFSAGWGGRLLAALSLGVNYIGFDTNLQLKPSYERIIKDYNRYGSKVQMIWKDSAKADFSKYKYDLIFTSPPYFHIEVYEHMKVQQTDDSFLHSFYIPVIKNSFKYLQKNGWMCLNIPDDMYIPTRKIMNRKPDKILQMKIHTRPSKMVTNRGYENIYCWHKKN